MSRPDQDRAGFVHVILGERHHWHAETEVWIEGVGRSHKVAQTLIGFALATGEYDGMKILADGEMIGPEWTQQEKDNHECHDWDVAFSIHEREVRHA